MKEAYTDIATADTYATSNEWSNATDTEKDQALLMASLWIDQNFTCEFDDPVQDEIQAATALLAEQYILGELFTPMTDAIKRQSIKAGSITTTKEFVSGNNPAELFPEAYLYLQGASCTVNSSVNKKLIRT
jgi:hypothetical protein